MLLPESTNFNDNYDFLKVILLVEKPNPLGLPVIVSKGQGYVAIY